MKRIACVVFVLGLLAGLLPLRARAVDLEVSSKSAVLMDSATGTVLYAQNEHEPLPPASVTKVMTLLLVMEAVDGGVIRLQDPVTASENAAAKGGSQIYLKVGEQMTVSDMIKSIAVSSANDCACAMAEHLAGSENAFVEQMNRKAKELGMNDTHFVNCTGLDDGADAASHKTSAYDIALMSRQLLQAHPDIKNYTTIWMDTVRDGAFGLSNTNKLVRFYPGATGLKTGFTAAAGYCLSAAAQREELELVAVVMGCATSQERFSACKTLLDYGFANYALIQPSLTEEASVPVKLGTEKNIAAQVGDPSPMLIEKSQKNHISTQIQLLETVTAPVSLGQRLGTMTVKAGDRILKQIPLVAAQSVNRLSWGQVFLKVLKELSLSV